MSPVSHRSSHRYWTHRGFTLLEILIVIVIIGVIISVATIALGVLGRDREMQDQAERLAAVLTQAKEETELQGFDVGLRVTDESYDFLRFDSRKQLWQPIVEDDFFSARKLPAGLRFRLWLEGREVILKPRNAEDASAITIVKNDASTKAAVDGNTADAKTDDAKVVDVLADDKEAPKEQPPQIMVLSSGDLNAFKLQFDREGTDAHWQVYSKPDGTLVAEQLNEAI